MTLLAPTPAIQQRIEQELYREGGKLQEDLTYLRDWLKLQPHLPHIDDDQLLERFLFGCKYSLEKTKRVLDMYYTVRSAVPEFFHNRDPLSTEVKLSSQVIHYFPVPSQTTEGYRVNITSLADTDANKFCPKAYMKRIFMIADVRLQEEGCVGEIMVFDLRGFSLSHLVKFTLPLAKKLLICGQDALPTRIKQIHILFAPSFVDKILGIFKPYMKEKLAERVYVHSGGGECLAKFMSREILPKDLGGSADTMQDLNNAWQEKLEHFRNWFLQEENRKVDESKRPGKLRIANELFGMEGSFKQLSID